MGADERELNAEELEAVSGGMEMLREGEDAVRKYGKKAGERIDQIKRNNPGMTAGLSAALDTQAKES